MVGLCVVYAGSPISCCSVVFVVSALRSLCWRRGSLLQALCFRLVGAHDYKHRWCNRTETTLQQFWIALLCEGVASGTVRGFAHTCAFSCPERWHRHSIIVISLLMYLWACSSDKIQIAQQHCPLLPPSYHHVVQILRAHAPVGHTHLREYLQRYFSSGGSVGAMTITPSNISERPPPLLHLHRTKCEAVIFFCVLCGFYLFCASDT